MEIAFGSSGKAVIDIDDLVITETPKAGWSVASHNGESVALDLTLTPELVEAGLVREAIRAIQEERKQSGFDISDRIHVKWAAGRELGRVISANLAQIGEEVLATYFVEIAENGALAESDIGLWLELSKSDQIK